MTEQPHTTNEQYKQLAIRIGVYAALALLVMAPFLKPGFILTLDMVFAPKITIPAYASGPLYLFWGVLHLLNFALSSAVIQKLILFGILFASGFGMHRFLQKIGPRSLHATWQWGCYFGGVLYMLNPFTYSRFMAGQFAVLLGYALTPFFVVALIRFCSRPSLRTTAWLVGWMSLIAIVSLHALGPMLIITLCLVSLNAFKLYKLRPWRRAIIKWGTWAVVGAIIVNSYWLVPTAFGKGTTAEIISSFKTSDLHAFATDPGHLGVFGNVLALQGFWGEGKNLFLTAADTYSWWLVPIVLLWSIVLSGMLISFRSRRSVTTAMLIIIGIGVVLAVGSLAPVVGPLNQWLVTHVPFFAGYREPQKFVGLIVFGYAYFGAVAIAWITNWAAEHNLAEHLHSVTAVMVLIPMLCSSLMMWGFHGQLRSTDYPVEWYAARDILADACTKDSKILNFPWHIYMRNDFAGRVVASPAQKFFGPHIIASNDPEMDGATAYRTSQDQADIGTKLLPQAERGDPQFVEKLKQRHIQYILLVKENDYKRYDFLADQKGLKVMHDIPNVTMYEVEK